MVIIVIILGVDSLLEINMIYKQCFPAMLQYNDVLCYVWNLNISVCVFKYIFMQMRLWCHLFMAPVLASPTAVNKDWNNKSKTFCTCPHECCPSLHYCQPFSISVWPVFQHSTRYLAISLQSLCTIWCWYDTGCNGKPTDCFDDSLLLLL